MEVFPIPFQEHTFSAATLEGSDLFQLTNGGFEKNNQTKEFEHSDYTLIYISAGGGALWLGNREYSLRSGDFIICRPHETKRFCPLESDPCEYFWVSFVGNLVTDLLYKLNLTSKENYFVGHDGKVVGALEKVLEELKGEDYNSSVIASSLFMVTLGTVSRIAIHMLPQDRTKGYDKIAPALSSINSDCTSKISVDEYAKMCNLSTSYFTHLFTKVTGFSPMEYKQLQRINIAKNLLTTTTHSVKEISNIIGFKDPLYFGRCFKQATGQTPSGYRSKK
jgi:AraC-like DNA-binding protein